MYMHDTYESDQCTDKVSIIVPIYNVEKYICRCVESLINQDYKNIEIILVDDGAKDESGEIIDRMALEDDRIIVIHKSNGGVSLARKVGIEKAIGKWITFVDGDDWVEPNYISYLLDIVRNNAADIGMGKNYFSVDCIESEDNCYCISSEEAQISIYKGDIFVAVWNKIYNYDFLKKYGIRFNEEIWYGEGMLFNIQCLQFINKIGIGEKSVYHQTFNPDSAMRKFNLKSNYCGLRSLEIQKEIIKESSKRLNKEWRYHKYCFNRSIIDGLIRSEADGQYSEEYKNCIHDLRKNIWIPLTTEKSLKKNLIWILYSIFPNQMSHISAKRFFDRMGSSI